MRQSLDQGLTLFHGLCTRLLSLDAYGLKAPIWKSLLSRALASADDDGACKAVPQSLPS